MELLFLMENRGELLRLVCADPGALMDEVESMGYSDVYEKARTATTDELQAERLISEMLALGQPAAVDLLEALRELRDKYEGLVGLLDSLPRADSDSTARGQPGPGSAAAATVSVQLPAALPAASRPPAATSFEAKLQACGDDKELLRRIVPLTPQLVQALQGNLLPILNELSAREVITVAERDKVKARSNNGGAAAATELLDIVEQKGRREARKFWLALWATRDTYTRLLDIFDEF
ncbi:uncharacterized protein LOC116956976 [Petromyzon marinus]|uniref:uncharacterized protein LOC116956976 n=1 Tax=Petromyzon marinus TaxID=7757 RepID=UPI003F708DBC